MVISLTSFSYQKCCVEIELTCAIFYHSFTLNRLFLGQWKANGTWCVPKHNEIALFVTRLNGLFFDSCFDILGWRSLPLINFNVLFDCRGHSLHTFGVLTFDILSFCTVIICLFCYHVSVCLFELFLSKTQK